MDDFVIFHHDKVFLWFVERQIKTYLEMLRLVLHQEKCRIFKTRGGVPFLGLLVFPHHRRLRRENVIQFKRKLKRFQKWYAQDKIDGQHVHQSIQAWIGYARHADTGCLRRALLEEVIFQRGKGD